MASFEDKRPNGDGNSRVWSRERLITNHRKRCRSRAQTFLENASDFAVPKIPPGFSSRQAYKSSSVSSQEQPITCHRKLSGSGDFAAIKIPPGFNSHEAYSRYQTRFLHSRVLIPRTINFKELAFLDLESRFSFQGWKSLAATTSDMFAEEVRVFYSNACFDLSSSTLTTYYENTRIELNPEILGTVLGIPSEGDRYFALQHWSMKDIDYNVALHLVFEDQADNALEKRKSSYLSLRHYVLHHFITFSLMPHVSHHDEVSLMDLYLLYCILVCRKVSLPFIILHRMNFILQHPTSSLAYGSYIHSILTYFRAPLKIHSLACHIFSTADEYTKSSLKRMKWKETPRGWIRSDGPDDGADTSKESCEPAGDFGEDLVHEEAKPSIAASPPSPHLTESQAQLYLLLGRTAWLEMRTKRMESNQKEILTLLHDIRDNVGRGS